MSKKIVYIYYLIKNDNVFYVGKTKNISKRKSLHRKLYGRDIDLLILDEVEDINWGFWESYWISQFKTWGFQLENKNNGGGGPTSWTEEQKLTINPQRIEKIKNNIERGLKISKKLKENNHSIYYTQEVKDKISKKLKGIKKEFTEEHKINLSKANLESKGKNVECFDLNDNFIKEFKCLREAKEWLLKIKPNISVNIDRQIKDCCNGRQKTCHGYKWRYPKI